MSNASLNTAMKQALPPIVVGALCLLAWQVLYSVTGFFAISSPVITAHKLAVLVGTAGFWADVTETGLAFLMALVLSVVAGVALGVALGLNRMAGDTLEPILVTFYSLPKVTLYPLVLLLFGLGISAKVAFGIMHGLVPITLMTRNAIKQVKPVYWRTAKALDMGRKDSIIHIVLPAILPELIAGIRIGFALSLLGVLIGEMFASKRGLGFAAVNAMNIGDIDSIMAIGAFLAGFAICCNYLLLSVERAARHRGSAH